MQKFVLLVRKIAAGDTSQLCVAYLLTLACSWLTSSVTFDRWLGIPHLDIINYAASPIEWLLLVLLMCAYLKPPRTTPPALLLERVRWFEYGSLLLFIGSVLFAVWFTHPNDEMYQRILAFLGSNHVLGGPLVAAAIGIVTVFPFFPAYAFIAPRTVLGKGVELIVVFFTLVGCFAISVIEAMYFSAIAPFIIRLLSKILLLFSWNVYANQQYGIISIDGFRVIIGPACAGFGYLLLFLLFFTYMVFMLGTKKKISSLRSFLALFLGLLCVFFLNILRIVTLMLVGIKSPDFALTLFHSIIGSVYFLLFFWMYFPVLKKWIGVKKG